MSVHDAVHLIAGPALQLGEGAAWVDGRRGRPDLPVAAPVPRPP